MKVGLIYHPIYLKHDTSYHVENASRLVEVMSLLETSHLKEELVALEPQPASVEDISLVHSREHISRIESTGRSGGGWLDGDTVMSKDSYEAALYAAGGAVRAVEAVVNGDVDSAFALVRPPGHHATYWRAMGFCLFNNIAIAVRKALEEYKLSRILIADFDVHHGNGTQDAFYTEPRVLYFSTHQYPFYPGTGSVGERGEGEGKGATVNVPLSAGCGDGEYLRAYSEILIPVARRFRPQLIVVSAGYDPHWADDISMMQVSTSGFARIVAILKQLADELCWGHIVFTLEGGYHLKALSYSVKATLDILLGKSEIDDPLGPTPSRRGVPGIDVTLEAVKRAHGLS
jgi:acetoin utilization deacetylase AcuC-like enzyme